MLSVRNIKKTFGEFALQDVSFDVAEGEYFVLLGPSGVGKTVVLETIAGLHLPRAGCIHLDGQDITREKIQNRGLSLVYHDRSLFPHMTVRRNVAYALRAKHIGRAETRRRVKHLAEAVGSRDACCSMSLSHRSTPPREGKCDLCFDRSIATARPSST